MECDYSEHRLFLIALTMLSALALFFIIKLFAKDKKDCFLFFVIPVFFATCMFIFINWNRSKLAEYKCKLSKHHYSQTKLYNTTYDSK